MSRANSQFTPQLGVEKVHDSYLLFRQGHAEKRQQQLIPDSRILKWRAGSRARQAKTALLNTIGKREGVGEPEVVLY